nr:unnamed protein product [Callosobruchus analis]
MIFFKSYLSRFANLDTVVEKDDYFQITNRLDKFKNILEEFNEIQIIIEKNTDDLDGEYINRQEFEDEYFVLTSKAQSLLDDYASAVLKESKHDASSVNSVQSASAQSVHIQYGNLLNTVRLLTIELPKFSGDYNDWTEFRDTFESLINSNRHIGNVQRFHYLRSSLQGSAKQIIDSLEFSEENYHVAWDLICSRYNNKRLLVYNHIKAIYDIPQVSHESSLDLRKLAECVTKHLRALENLGQPTDSWDTLVIYSLTTKLDKASFKEWERFRGSSELSTLGDFKTFIKTELTY